MRSSNKTSGTTMFLRYLMICAPVGIVITLIFPLLFVPLVFFGVLALVWFLNWGLTNTVVRHFTPDYFNAMKSGGGDPFLDNLGAPLNMDSESVRQQGAYPNVACPHCGVGAFVMPGTTVNCSSCGGRFTY